MPDTTQASTKNNSILQQQPSRWYAVYTQPRAEKQVHKRLQETGIEVFLPLQKTKRQWSDRIKWINKPLISSYIFVKVTPKEYPQVYRTSGVVKFITFEGQPVAIPEVQINNLKLLVNSDVELEVTGEKYDKGDYIEVVAGSLIGLRGELIKIGSNKRVVVRIDSLDHNIIVSIPTTFLTKINQEKFQR